MHKEVIHFITSMSIILLKYFNNSTVLDVGGGDINGNNRYVFKNCDYSCNDVIESANVTHVSRTKDLKFKDGSFDTIISTECFEHDPEYIDSFFKIYKLLKPNGLFIFTCASTGRPEHGTRKCKPHQSYGTIEDIEDMRDYYKNLTIVDLNQVINSNNFILYKSYYNSLSKDLYFVGIKRDCNNDSLINDIHINYAADNVTETTNLII